MGQLSGSYRASSNPFGDCCWEVVGLGVGWRWERVKSRRVVEARVPAAVFLWGALERLGPVSAHPVSCKWGAELWV